MTDLELFQFILVMIGYGGLLGFIWFLLFIFPKY